VSVNILILSTLKDLSALLEVPGAELLRLAGQIERSYRKKVEAKPSGGYRVYFIPNSDLMKVQRCIHRSLLRHLPVHDSIHSYRRKRDTISNASVHVGNPILVKLDIKDFFPSVRPNKVYKMFMEKGCSSSVAKLLTTLTTFKNQLPQGPPTSPAIANQVLAALAKRMSGVCVQHGLALSVFGDDICVSGSKRAAQVRRLLGRIVESEGFSLNLEKSGVRKAGEKKTVTGISVNEKINVDKNYYRRVRALVHHAATKGYGALFSDSTPGKAREKLRGMIRYVARLNSTSGDQLQKTFLMIEKERVSEVIS
jgi:RNA-directed DNA polymerase